MEHRIRAIRRSVRLAADRIDGRCGAVSEALEHELGLTRLWGHLRLLDGSVCWMHCWNQADDGSIIDATADQFEELFPGDVLVLAPDDPLAHRYLAAPPPCVFDLQLLDGRLQLAIDGVGQPPLPDEPQAWTGLANIVLGAMSPWPQPAAVRAFVADYLRARGPGPFTKRDVEASIDLWAWRRREARRGRPWLPGDIERDAAGRLRPRTDAVEVRPVESVPELAKAITLAAATFPGLHERTGRAPGYYPDRFPEQADLQVVAVVGDKVVGLALGSLSPDGTAAGVGEVAVDPLHRGRGVGRSMLAELEARARARGLARLALGADEDVLGFYVACGWEPRVQVSIQGADQQAIFDRLRVNELFGREYSEQQHEGAIRVSVSVDGYDTALAERVSAVEGCSAFVMFTKTLHGSQAE